MTRLGFFTAGLAAITIGTAGNASAAEWEDVEFYPFEEATLTYTVTGMQAGSQVQIIMESGRKTASLMDTQMNI